MAIYLHELVQSVPGRTEDYLDGIAEHHGRASERLGRKDGVVGLWSALEATGAWPLAVNLWRWGSWQDAAANLTRQFDGRAQDPELKRWWLANLDLRTGGFDRLVESTSYSPDVPELRSRGVAGVLFLHQIATVSEGAVDEYLAAFGGEGVTAAEASGALLVGAYRVRLRDDEALTLLAFPAATDFARFQESWYDPATSLGRWRVAEDRWVRQKASLVLKPRHFLGSPWHP
jgi:hypothetical protein